MTLKKLKKTLLKIVNGLKNKKAKDAAKWKNEYIKNSGKEMLKSINIIMKHVDKTLTTPSEWNKLDILSIHKKGPKPKMKNKRGLFITNLISKVYERIIKDRNKERSKVSPMQTGGIKDKSTIDNVMTLLAIIERNNYLNKTTFLTFADVEKCFDKLWLEDGIKELWRNGMSARDCIALKKLNELAEATVKTPIGSTEEIILNNTVRQGTVNGPPICAATMDTVNSIGYDSITHYGPHLIIKTLAYVDDLGSAGGAETANSMIMNCNIMEERKKIKFNTDKGKSAYLTIHEKKGSGVITATVEKGEFQEVEEYKYLGVWLDKTGQYKINIFKKKEKIPYMISSTKRIASTQKMGKLSTQARLKMMNSILVMSILYNVEAFATFTNKELELLEGAQAQIVRQLLELPISTPYFPLLLETGTWTMEGRINYKKLMLFHNIMNSPDERILKNVICEQMRNPRKGTWYHTITELLARYEIGLAVTEVKKSTWKKHVKSQVEKIVVDEIRLRCLESSKGRTIVNDKFEMKQYLKELPVETASKIAKTRLHMVQIPCNYGDKRCKYCEETNANTEHYLECPRTMLLRECCGVTKKDELGNQDLLRMIQISEFYSQIERMNINNYCPSWKK